MRYQVGDVVKVVCETVPGVRDELVRGQTGVVDYVWDDSDSVDVRLSVGGDVWSFGKEDIEPYIGVGGTPRLQPPKPLYCTGIDREKGIIFVGSAPPPPPKPRFSTLPQEAFWKLVDQFTKGMVSSENPEKVRGLYGWRETAKKHGLEEARMMYLDSLMRHVRKGEWAAVAANALILLDLDIEAKRDHDECFPGTE